MKQISIIGGADGPTAVFYAGKIGQNDLVYWIIGGIILFTIAGIIYFKHKD